MDLGGITVKFAADFISLLSGVEDVIASVESVGETASAVGELSASFDEASGMAAQLSSNVSGIAESASAISEVATSASELDSSLSEVGSAADQAGSGLSSISDAAGSVDAVQNSLSGVNDSLQQVATTAEETASQVEANMGDVATSADEAATQTGQAGQKGGTGFFDGMSKVGMTFFAIQGGVQMVQNAFQQATGPFGNFQEQMTQLVTGAGESESNLNAVSGGIKNMAVQTGESTDQLSAGMYMIESAGYHGAQGLAVLQAAAEGSKVGAADLATVANAVTSALNAYGLQGKDAATVTNELIATVAAGKMHMQDLANSLAAVLPVAAAAHISYAQVGGAIATMTAQGTSAQQAAQNLANTIRSLQNPNAVAVKEMLAMGLSSNQVAMQLGKKGLTGTLDELTQAILSHMGPAGTVLQSAFANSTNAAADAKEMIAAMPANLQKMAQSFLSGSITTKEWTKDLSGLDPITKKMMTQFATTAEKTHSFNDLLRQGGPAAQTYTAALAKILGGSTGLNTALQLTGTHMSTFQSNVDSISQAAKNGGSSITGWNLVQQDFNQKMAVAAAQAQVFMINLGSKLAPVILTVMDDTGKVISAIASFVNWMSQGSVGATAIKAALIGIAVALGVAVIPGMIAAAATAVISFGAWAIAQIPVIIGTLAIAAPYILIGAIVAAVVFGIIEAIQHWGAIGGWLKQAWANIIGWLGGALNAIGAFFQSVWQGILHFFRQVWADIVSVAKIVGMILLGVLIGPIGLAVLFIITHWTQVKAFLSGLWQSIVGLAKTLWTDITGAITGILTTIEGWITGFWDREVSGWTNLWNRLKEIATSLWNDVKAAFDTAVSWLENLGITLWNDEVRGWTEIWNSVKRLATQLWADVTGVFTAAKSTVLNAVTNLWNSIINFVSSWPGQALQWGKDLIQNLINGILGMVGNLGNAVGSVANKIKSFLHFSKPDEGPLATSDTWMPDFVAMLAQGLDEGRPIIQAAVTHLIQPTTALASYQGDSNTPTSPLQGNGGNTQNVQHIHIYLDGQELGGQVVDHVMTQVVSQASAAGPVRRAA